MIDKYQFTLTDERTHEIATSAFKRKKLYLCQHKNVSMLEK